MENNTNFDSLPIAIGIGAWDSLLHQSDPWLLVQEGYNTNNQLDLEHIFSIGNKYIKQRGSFEEFNSGNTILGSFINGMNISESTPELENSINMPNWTSILVRLNEEMLDLATWEVINFRRTLNMRSGILERTFNATSPKGNEIQVSVKRFLSMAENEIGAISYSVKSINFDGRISFTAIIDADIKGKQLYSYPSLWNVLQTKTQQEVAHLWNQLKLKDFHVCSAMSFLFYKNNELLKANPTKIEKEKIAGFGVGIDVRSGDTVCINKFVAITSLSKYPRQELTSKACELSLNAKQKGWNQLFEEHTAVWNTKWKHSTILESDSIAKQQEMIYNFFQSF